MKGRQHSASSVSAFSFPPRPIITLLTDFGTADYFVAAMKGVILGVNPNVTIVDVTHEIPPHDIEAGAFVLLTACDAFPAGTIHVGVVDPGVGSSRRALLIRAGDQFFVGPDNGLFSYVAERLSVAEVFHLTNPKYFRDSVSQTFNGRDVFAPVAAALSTGVTPDDLGIKVSDYVKLRSLRPDISSKGINGRIIHIDRFGNCVTNITRSELSREQIEAGATLKVNGRVVKSFKNYFAEATKSKDRVFAIWGSAGFLEIAVTNQSAAKFLQAKRSDHVVVSL